MSYTKGKKTRPLGALRNSIKTSDKIPSLLKPKPDAPVNTEKLDKNYEGIHGNAMSVPPQSEKKEQPEKSKHSARSTGSDNHSTSSASVASQEMIVNPNDGKELKEALAREKALKQEIVDLQKIIDELRALLREREKTIAELEEQLEEQENKYKEKLEIEKKNHQQTKSNLENSRKEMQGLKLMIEQLTKEHNEKIIAVRVEMDRQISEITAAKDKEIAEREEKLNRLKKQMADALKGNSWERQQQLEELTKELSRIQEEADLLRMKLKAYSRHKQGNCANCSELTSKLDKCHATLKDKDGIIKELKSLCGRFEKQLSQQDELLKNYAESKGYKVSVPK